MLSIQVNNKEVAKIPNTQAHLNFHTPRKNGEHGWKIVNEETGETVDSYNPPRKTKPVVCTPYKGSWAETMQR